MLDAFASVGAQPLALRLVNWQTRWHFKVNGWYGLSERLLQIEGIASVVR
jgi:hypothetical protein